METKLIACCILYVNLLQVSVLVSPKFLVKVHFFGNLWQGLAASQSSPPGLHVLNTLLSPPWVMKGLA